MFRLVVYCEDKQLGPVLIALAGKAAQVDTPQPVINAQAGTGGKLIASSGGTLGELFAAYLAKAGLTSVRVRDASQWLESIGRNRANARHVILAAIRLGALRKPKGKVGTGNKHFYEVLVSKAAAEDKS